mmetsp:Transcript_45439/g.98089  ORF Transcript_45439/g.98089 Transcript_45439/m.98089 type:complete len:824 (+) Transcript_45439:223-2694(+)
MAMEAGAAAAAAASGVGLSLFNYNRGNYQFDQKVHYTRFTAGLNMAIAQTGLYKQDIAQLTELTVARQDCYHGIAAMGLTILTAIYCPGRVGLHEPPPPGWLQGLEFVNIAGCYLFLGLALWYAMHASMRADTAATHMLTRFVRLPIPSQGQLDKARKFLSSYEEQPLSEVLRVPFTRHSGAKKGKKGGFNEDFDIDDEAKARTRHGHDVPAWYKKEKAVDNWRTSETIESMMPLSAKGDAPEHFEAYRELQMEWFPYDVYARLSIFLAFMHLIHCWTYLQIGYLFQEVRAMWACAIVMLPMFVLQQIILTLDIIPGGVPIHRVGPFGLWFAYFAAFIEYKRWFDAGSQGIGFVLVYICYAIHIVYTLALYRLCAPSEEAPAVACKPGASWWPAEWRLPLAFQHAIWLVAPPLELQEGENDIVGELRAAQGNPVPACGAVSDEEKRRDVHKALGKQGESPAWMGVKVGLISLVIAWVWLTFGFTIEIINQGTTHPSLLSAPGNPNQARDPRYRPAKVGASEPVEVGTGGALHGPAVGVHSSAVHRRLSLLNGAIADISVPASAEARVSMAERVRAVLPILKDIARSGSLVADVADVDMDSLAVQWPALFEPQHLACRSDLPPLALSKSGRGAVVLGSGETKAFTLRGVAGAGSILAASFQESGLKVLTSTGSVFDCAGAVPVDGKWKCKVASEAKLPLGKNFAGSVALGETATGIQVAVRFPEEDSVVIFKLVSGSFVPVGEVRIPTDAQPSSFSSEGQELLLMHADGKVSTLDMTTGSIVEAKVNSGSLLGHSWTAACSRGDQVARLAVAKAADTPAKLMIA